MVEAVTPPSSSTPPAPASDLFNPDAASEEAKAEAIDKLRAINPLLADVLTAAQFWFEDKRPLAEKTGFVLSTLVDFLVKIETEVAEGSAPIANSVVKAITALLKPVAETFGIASKAYVQTVGSTIGDSGKGQPEMTDVSRALGADFAFDAIVKPIAFIASSNDPTQPGAGAENIQKTLGAIVSIHLMTWVINVVSNLTGLGTLKFMNSFNEVILAAMNARGMTRVAMRPYLETFMVQPATNSLNNQWPTKQLSESATIKAFMRGALSPEQARSALRTAGYTESFAAQFLTDAQKYLNEATIGKMVNLGWWTTDQAITYLQQAGWSQQMAPVVLQFARNEEVFSILRDAAERLQAKFEQGLISLDEFTQLLHDMEFSDNEIEALTVRAQASAPKPKTLSFTQVKELYLQNLVDLDFVQSFLLAQGYNLADTNLLILLDFTEKKDRDLQKQVLEARARLLEQKLQNDAQIALNKSNQALADAEKALAAAEAKLASSLVP